MSRLEIRQQPSATSGLAALLGQVARGDHRAFELVYAELAAPVYGLVRQVLRDPAHVQAPWKLPAARRERLGYPGPIVELS